MYKCIAIFQSGQGVGRSGNNLTLFARLEPPCGGDRFFGLLSAAIISPNKFFRNELWMLLRELDVSCFGSAAVGCDE